MALGFPCPTWRLGCHSQLDLLQTPAPGGARVFLEEDQVRPCATWCSGLAKRHVVLGPPKKIKHFAKTQVPSGARVCPSKGRATHAPCGALVCPRAMWCLGYHSQPGNLSASFPCVGSTSAMCQLLIACSPTNTCANHFSYFFLIYIFNTNKVLFHKIDI